MSEENINRARVKIVETLYDLLALDQVSPADVRLAFFKILMPWESTPDRSGDGKILAARRLLYHRSDVCGQRVTSHVVETEQEKIDARLKQQGYILL